MSHNGFYGIDQSATSAQGQEYTIPTRWSVECVPGLLNKRGQEKCSCPLLSGLGTHQERLLPAFFFQRWQYLLGQCSTCSSVTSKCRSGLQGKRDLRPLTRIPWPCSIRKEHCTLLTERRRSGLASQRSLRKEARLSECNFEKIGKEDFHGPVVV